MKYSGQGWPVYGGERSEDPLFFSGAAGGPSQRGGSRFASNRVCLARHPAAPLQVKRLVKDAHGYKQATPDGVSPEATSGFLVSKN